MGTGRAGSSARNSVSSKAVTTACKTGRGVDRDGAWRSTMSRRRAVSHACARAHTEVSGETSGAAISTSRPSRAARKKQLRRPVWQATPT